MKHLCLILVSVILIVFNGCSSTNEVDVYHEVEGIVLNGGEPVSDAHIHIRNHFEPGGFTYAQSSDKDYTLSINIPTNGNYSASLFRYNADSILTTFFEGTLTVGNREFTIPDSLLSNGLFGYEISNSFGSIATGLFSVNKPDNLLPETLPFTTTQADGHFFLNADMLALGYVFSTSGGGRFETTDSLQIIVTNSFEVLKKKTIRVPPNQDNFFEINID